MFTTTHRHVEQEPHGDVPTGRSSLVAQVHGNSLFIFGGYNGQVVLNDFYEWRFQPLLVPPPTLQVSFLLCFQDENVHSGFSTTDVLPVVGVWMQALLPMGDNGINRCYVRKPTS